MPPWTTARSACRNPARPSAGAAGVVIALGAGVLLAALVPNPDTALAQQPAARPASSEQQMLGRQLFTQSCGICHLKPQITAGTYGPVLSKETLGGDADAIATVIGNGIPARMPGFRHHFTPPQIAAIAAYLKTLPPPAKAAPPAGKGAGKPNAADATDAD